MKKVILDGNAAAAHAAYAFSQLAVIYPITPSSPMAECVDEWSAAGRKNLFGEKTATVQMQSEGGVAGALHGALSAGAATVSFTSSQGLLLMLPDLYKLAGELLPTVVHVAARSIATHALCIFGDHSDVMACRQTGAAMLCSASVQESADLAVTSHLAAYKTSLPFLHFFDGFRTSHELSTAQIFDEKNGYEELSPILQELNFESDLARFRARSLNPEHPVQRGTAQNPDVFFQNRERANPAYENAPAIVQRVMNVFSKHVGRTYKLFDYVGDPDAESVIVAMGSATETIEEYIRADKQGSRYGLIKVRLYRPFSADAFLSALPAACKRLAILDRTKESGSVGEPLYTDICALLKERKRANVTVIGGRYGLGSKEFTPTMVGAIFKNLQSETLKNHFTVGIVDDVTHTSLPLENPVHLSTKERAYKFYGFGSDGTVSAVKSTAKLVGAHTDLYAQAYFVYDSKKSGGITISHLRFSPNQIKSPYLIEEADFIACHSAAYVRRYDMLSQLKEGGVFLLNSPAKNARQLEQLLPPHARKTLAEKKANLFVIAADEIARNCGISGKTSLVLQTAFFTLNAYLIPTNHSLALLKESVKSRFSKKGQRTVEANLRAIDEAKNALLEIPIPASWNQEPDPAIPAELTTCAAPSMRTGDPFFDEVAIPIRDLRGDQLPVSAFSADGSVPTDTAKHEKRGVALFLPRWQQENCIQCTQCSFVCPHACIRPVLLTEDVTVPDNFPTKPALQANGYRFKIQLSPQDCMGCGVCAQVCPANRKAVATAEKNNAPLDESKLALNMKKAEEIAEQESSNWQFSRMISPPPQAILEKMPAVKRSQFRTPLFEFSGACAGCGETPYIKVLTQLFGEDMIIANATGCSSIYGGTFPTCPYAKTSNGNGPAWANSLFEDNAEFGLGIRLAYNARRNQLRAQLQRYEKTASTQLKNAIEAWSNSFSNVIKSKETTAQLLPLLTAKKQEKEVQEILAQADCLSEKSVWIVGGDGWAYDIGYGGLDHVLASGENVNVLVLDSETYSNTGGQVSKATPLGAVAKFALQGKRLAKKDLGLPFLSYGYVYVAQCAMGADQAQLLKALQEAESYHGPSLVICYSPCIAQGLEMKNSQAEQKRAVDCGHWHLYRYDPLRRTNPNTPFTLDSKAPTTPLPDFLNSEIRFSSLRVTAPNAVEEVERLSILAQQRKTKILTALSKISSENPPD